MNPAARMKSFLKLPARRPDLHEHAAAGDLTGLRVALQSSADVNRPDKNGKTALHIAVDHGYEAMVRELLSRRANVAIQDGDDQTPLHIASLKQYPKIAAMLLAALDHVQDQRKVLNARNKHGCTALMEAARRGNLQLVQTLMSKGADPFKVGLDGRNALHLAVQSGQVPLVQLLVYQAGLDVNVPVRGTHSRPLHYAARRGDVQMVQLLLTAGADPSMKNEHGQLAVQLAEEGQQYSVIAAIQKHERQVMGQASVGSPPHRDDPDALPHSHQLADVRGTLQELSIPSPSTSNDSATGRNWASPPGGHRRHQSVATPGSSGSPPHSARHGGGSGSGPRASWTSPVEASAASSTARLQHATCTVTDYEAVNIPPPANWSPPPARAAPGTAAAGPLPRPPPQSPSLPPASTPATPSPGPSLSTPPLNSERGMASAGSAGSKSSSRWMTSPSTPSVPEPVYIPPPTTWNAGISLLPLPKSLLDALGPEEDDPPQAAPPQRPAPPPASPKPTPPPAPRPKLAQSLPEQVAIPPADAHDAGPLSAGRAARTAPGLPPPSGQPSRPSPPPAARHQPLRSAEAPAAARTPIPSPRPADDSQQHPQGQATASPESLVAYSPLAARRPQLPSSTGSTPPATSPRDAYASHPPSADSSQAGRHAAPSRPSPASPSPSPSPSSKAGLVDPDSRSLQSLTQEAAAARAQAAAARSPAVGQAAARDTSSLRDTAPQLPPSPALPVPEPPAARRATADLAWEAITGSSSAADNDDDGDAGVLHQQPPAARRHTTSDLPLRALGQHLPADPSPPIVQALRSGPRPAPAPSAVPAAPRRRTVAQLQLEQPPQLTPTARTPSVLSPTARTPSVLPPTARTPSVLSPTSSGAMSPPGSRRAGPPPTFDPDKPFFHFLLQANGGKQR